MAENREFVIQTRLGSEQKQDYYIFPRRTMIWPRYSGRGVLTSDLQARRKEGEEIEGFQAWVAEGRVRLFLDRKHWQLSSGTEFGAPVSSAKKRKA